jgi:amino acid adenylation domain-containing protein
MNQIKDRIAQLSPEKRELLQKKLQEKQEKPIIPIIKAQNRDKNTFPLSFAQERLWFLNQLEPDNSFYNQPTALHLKGKLDLDVLKQTFQEIIRRHENLRTNFTTIDGKPIQIIQPVVDFEILIVDLTTLTSSDREIPQLVEQEAEKPFNLEKDLLLRTTLLRLNSLEHIVLFTTHHIISDGWSTGILVGELATLYQTFLEGKRSPLPELSIQYADFAVWQREWLQGDRLNTQLNYWKQQLGNNPPILNLPTNYSRPNKLTYQGATEFFTLSESLTNALKTLSQTEGVTLFMTLLAAFKVLLYRHSFQEDIVVGTPIANRNYQEIESLIGFFVNTLVLRTKLDSNSSFRDLLQQVKEITLGAYSHQDLPFEQIVEELKPERHLNRNPLFDVMFVLQNAPEEELKLPELTINSLAEDNQTIQFDLTLSLRESDRGLTGAIDYSTDLFNADTIKRMIGHFQTLLESITTNPLQKLSELSILTARERQQLLGEWNNTNVKYPTDKCIHQLFEEQVIKNPNAIAVVFENQQLTYRELNERANQLAQYLRNKEQGTRKKEERLIGILLDRSLEMVISIIAILKAGGAYIPIDTTHPIERWQFILENSQASLLITQSHLQEKLDNFDIPTICLDTDYGAIQTQPNSNPINQVETDRLAYIIYTSGSTGTPKGVEIPHRNIVRLFAASQNIFQFNHTDVWTLFHSYAFDFSVWEIWGALIYGGKLIIVPYCISRSPDAFYKLLIEQKVTVLNQTPSAFRQLIEVDSTRSQANYLRWIIFGGEALSIPSLKPWFDKHGDDSPQLVNMYGITETTVHVTYRLLSKLDLEAGHSSIIGRPLPDLQVYLLDSCLQPVPIGVTAEIYVGGDGLARGYFKRSRLTQEKFIPNPFLDWYSSQIKSLLPSAFCLLPSLYKTGDLARYLPNGELEYLGRIDNQVKIRGFRLELGEIEAFLRQYPLIKDCVVIVREDTPDDKRLVAYLVTKEKLEVKQLREFLKSKLPDYMIPAAWVELDAFPLTPNGKCDRNSLPIPDSTIAQESYLAPRTATEKILANIWQEVLNLPQIGINDNFFDLGGHSLIATQVVSKIRQILSIELPLRYLFELSTLAELAAEIEQWSKQTKIPPIQPISRDRAIPLSFAQQRLWFMAQLEPDSSVYNVFDALRLQGKLEIQILIKTFKAIIGRHETLRTNFTTVVNEPVQVIHPTLDFQLPIIDLTTLSQAIQQQEVNTLIARESETPFDLEKDSLLRVILIRLNENEHLILVTMHHIISDGWSTGILVREVATLYQAFLEGKRSPLPELPIQYADYAVWQRDYLQGEVLDKQLSYWKQKLGGRLPVLKLPYRKSKPAIKTNSSLSHNFELSRKLSIALQQLSHQTKTTLFMVILATLKTLLYRYTQQEDIVVGVDIANRNRAETEGLIGFFVNLLVLRTDLSGYPSFRELLTRVREVTLSAYAHQDLPFEQLVRELETSRESNRTTLFQVLLVMDNVPTQELKLPGLTISPMEEVDSQAKFDLVLFISETATGISGSWKYNSDLFDTDTITKISNHYVTLLQNIVSQPDTRINNLEMISKTEKEEKKMTEVTKEKNKFNKFLKAKPKAVSLPSSEELIKTNYLQTGQSLPLVITPAVKDLDIFDWVKNEKQFLESKLLKHGAILFRNCQLNSIADFEKLAENICPNLFSNYGDLPRTGVSDKVYGSTPYPADKTILFHNESSHLHCYPQKIWFFCIQPALEGGETPIVDCRQVYQLLDSKVREKLEQKQLMYVRNYIEGLDVSWQNFFHTEDKSVVEDYCHKSEMQFEWLPNNGLRTRKIRPAIALHPMTQEKTFFNQIQLHHISYLDPHIRDSLLSVFGEENLPRNVYYGDGSSLKTEDIEAINTAYQQAKISFPWQQGDVLMLDNLLTAHSRNPYKGDRKIVVTMGDIVE